MSGIVGGKCMFFFFILFGKLRKKKNTWSDKHTARRISLIVVSLSWGFGGHDNGIVPKIIIIIIIIIIINENENENCNKRN